MTEQSSRDSFKTRWGFILACAGSAVGLGNLWMFPWRLGEFGGAAFLIPYLVFVYILGTTGLMGEFGFGRWAQRGAVGAYDKVLREKGLGFGRLLGAYPVLVLLGVFIFYLIVTGWVIRYFTSSVGGSLLQAPDVDAYFAQVSGQPVSIFWLFLAAVITAGILAFGIAKGIERANKFLMPVLIGVLVILLVRALTLSGAMEGLRYILVPDWSYLLKQYFRSW